MGDKNKAIEICNNLIGTLNKIPKEKRILYSDNEMFAPPSMTRNQIIYKIKKFKEKYDIGTDELRAII